MGEGLLTTEVKAALEEIVAKCFYNNRMLDRIVSILSVKFVMPVTGDIIHHRLAHLYPNIADLVSDYMAERNCTTIYNETPAGNQDYDSPLDCFNYMLELNLDLENIVKKAIKVSHDEGDYTTTVFLDSFLRMLIPITDDMLLLVDKATMYGNSNLSWMKYDNDIEDFYQREEY